MLEINKLYCMDNLELMKQLPDKCIDLIYCDILYNTGKKFKDFDDRLGTPQEAMRWYEPRLLEMYRILKDTGNIYLQCDWHLNAYIRIKLDEIFGINNFINEIIWSYQGTGTPKKGFKRKHDTIFLYSKTKDFYFNKIYAGEPFGKKQKVKYTFYDEEKQQYYKEYRHSNGQVYRQYWDENKIMRMRDVWEIPIIQSKIERTGYPTQKPKALLERIIKASSNKGDIVADFFCGSGTTCVVAKELGRSYIGCDINPRAIEIAEKRLNKI